jgi:CHAD domain-containing protein
MFHELRKRAKYLWYHMRMLRPAWPVLLSPLAHETHRVTGELGDANDLADLLNYVQDDAEARALLVPTTLARLQEVALNRIERAWRDALPSRRRLYAEPPERFAFRIGRYWQVWRPPVSRPEEAP